MTPQQCVEDLLDRLCEMRDVYNESTLNDVFVKGVDPQAQLSFCNYFAIHPQTDLTDTTFLAKLLPASQKGSRIIPTKNYQQTRSGKPYIREPWNSRQESNNINTNTSSSSSHSLRQPS